MLVSHSTLVQVLGSHSALFFLILFLFNSYYTECYNSDSVKLWLFTSALNVSLLLHFMAIHHFRNLKYRYVINNEFYTMGLRQFQCAQCIKHSLSIMKTWVQMHRTHIKLDTVTHVRNLKDLKARWKLGTEFQRPVFPRAYTSQQREPSSSKEEGESRF